jgi:hypothetical protein
MKTLSKFYQILERKFPYHRLIPFFKIVRGGSPTYRYELSNNLYKIKIEFTEERTISMIVDYYDQYTSALHREHLYI